MKLFLFILLSFNAYADRVLFCESEIESKKYVRYDHSYLSVSITKEDEKYFAEGAIEYINSWGSHLVPLEKQEIKIRKIFNRFKIKTVNRNQDIISYEDSKFKFKFKLKDQDLEKFMGLKGRITIVDEVQEELEELERYKFLKANSGCVVEREFWESF
jgi:hypothetical protein